MNQDDYPQITQEELDRAIFRVGHRPVSQIQGAISDLQKYIERRKASDPEFAEDFESGYADFKTRNIIPTTPSKNLRKTTRPTEKLATDQKTK